MPRNTIYARIALTEEELGSLASLANGKPDEIDIKLHDAIRRGAPTEEVEFYQRCRLHWLTLVAKLDKPFLDDTSQDVEEEEDNE